MPSFDRDHESAKPKGIPLFYFNEEATSKNIFYFSRPWQ